MKDDPFGNLRDWGSALNIIDELAVNGQLAECQPGLIRILRYKGNWRLREEVLKRAGDIPTPSIDLFLQVLAILDDDNIYYDARILAGEAMSKLLRNVQSEQRNEISNTVKKVVEKLRSIPQPPIFDNVLRAIHSELGLSIRSDT
jgi:hypothetical protein